MHWSKYTLKTCFAVCISERGKTYPRHLLEYLMNRYTAVVQSSFSKCKDQSLGVSIMLVSTITLELDQN